jgi:hypothetical protein
MSVLNTLILDKKIKYLQNESPFVILPASLSTAEVVVFIKTHIRVLLYQRCQCTEMQ